MKIEGIKEIIELNRNFYTEHNESFDKSRSYGFWEGFEEILKYLPSNLQVLDLGCGNARFLRFLLEKNQNIVEYLGLDNSEEFINKNSKNYEKYQFRLTDVITNLNKETKTYNLVVAFGITHHIPSRELRKKWFEKIATLVAKNGVLVISFWNFNKNNADQKFKPQFYITEPGDFFLGWKGDFGTHRYCHYFEESEVTETISQLKDFKLLSKFDKDFNTYLTLKKN
jgi:tRNA (uracil-5-)-methyltransferase TRM9